jgi:hypothetical protein
VKPVLRTFLLHVVVSLRRGTCTTSAFCRTSIFLFFLSPVLHPRSVLDPPLAHAPERSQYLLGESSSTLAYFSTVADSRRELEIETLKQTQVGERCPSDPMYNRVLEQLLG